MDKQNWKLNEARQYGWEQMETLLDREMKRKKRPFYISALPYAASLLLLIGIGFQLWNQPSMQNAPFRNEIEIKPINEKLLRANEPNSVQPNQNGEIASTNSSANNGLEFSENVPSQNDTFSPAEPSSAITTQRNTEPASISPTLLPKSNSDVGQLQTTSLVPKQTLINSEIVRQRQADQQAKNRVETTTTNDFVTNQAEQDYKVVSSFEIPNTFTQPNLDFGLQSHGSVGLVSKNMEDYGLRLGFEVAKPISKNLSLNTGVRYSTYKDQYNQTYDVSNSETGNYLVEQLSHRDVDRRFVELPVYADYNINNFLSIKSGFSVTYNTNNSDDTNTSPLAIAGNSALSDEAKREAGQLLNDQHGYLGEAVLGASIEIEKITLDVEGTYGVISNQEIDNRNIIGARISYRFGN